MSSEKGKTVLFRELRKQAEGIISGSGPLEDKMKAICILLSEKVDYYDWVGFYLARETSDELMLGPFVGEPTEHVCIPFGKGICGRVADTKTTLVVQEVAKETNYIACAPDVKSEIVVPIFKGNDGETFVGEIDIDSHSVSPFSWEDRFLLEGICGELGKHF